MKRKLLRKSITTEYFPYTSTRGARIIAKDSDNNKIILKVDGTDFIYHSKAVIRLCEKMNWSGTLVCGSIGGKLVWTFSDNLTPKVKVFIPSIKL